MTGVSSFTSAAGVRASVSGGGPECIRGPSVSVHCMRTLPMCVPAHGTGRTLGTDMKGPLYLETPLVIETRHHRVAPSDFPLSPRSCGSPPAR